MKQEANNGQVSIDTIRRALELQEIANTAVRKAQEENRRKGIPNWYSINGVIVSDQQLMKLQKEREEAGNSSTHSSETETATTVPQK
ncbi:MAG TPA: hypothetical protein VFC63_08740 [Blastocatellia bacterium]|nr:hypothetical protein [Blastocatellia bacterium]